MARGEPCGKVGRRLLAVRLALLGPSSEAVGPHVLRSGRQVKTWASRYNAGGAAALAPRPKSGRPGPLTAESVRALVHDADRDRWYAFTAAEYFEVAEPVVPKPHAVKALRTGTGRDALDTGFYFGRAVRGLPPAESRAADPPANLGP